MRDDYGQRSCARVSPSSVKIRSWRARRPSPAWNRVHPLPRRPLRP